MIRTILTGNPLSLTDSHEKTDDTEDTSPDDGEDTVF